MFSEENVSFAVSTMIEFAVSKFAEVILNTSSQNALGKKLKIIAKNMVIKKTNFFMNTFLPKPLYNDFLNHTNCNDKNYTNIKSLKRHLKKNFFELK